ncbi:MAG: nicotinate (nicotinamide) nucleotide adenylyltransferase [Polyangiaceae bacterium UTPRO1]|jgi:nicotinate-nucleotide adenylyltransferase|nr:nicotinate-nucleotide adenylyltransferase [Myxococcales bacterium]OQY67184.1 MAG: nicotinate (nicotinamide) nucleotide adenylyltransferase [Polyangiaceae bacterium UTPRO1]
MRRLGLFGGTFDPVHLGHLRTAEEAREALALDRVDLVLSARPPHKAADHAPIADRRRMLELAVPPGGPLGLDFSEVERAGPSYSIDTVRQVQAREPDAQITLIVGADAFAEIGTWKDFATIFTLCDFCVTSRPETSAGKLPIAVENAFCYEPTRGVYVHRSGRALRFLPVTALMISASDIRRRCAEGRSIRYLVPDAVVEYVAAHGLYSSGRTAAR